ncbi:MAG TPA: hypothetical protein VGE67_04045 [Haloferula sp.]
MKTKLPWMAAAAVLLAACNEKQEPTAAQPKLPQPSSSKRFTPDRPAAKPAPVAPPIIQEAPTPTPAAPPAAPKPAPAPTLSAAEREAQRAAQRQQRIARVTEQMTTRLKERDANGDGLLTQNELSGGMQRGFTRADTNGDGSLDATEQQAMIQSMAERAGNSDRRDRNDRRTADRRYRGGYGYGFGFGGFGRGRDD